MTQLEQLGGLSKACSSMNEREWSAISGGKALDHPLAFKNSAVRLRRQQLATDDHIRERHGLILHENNHQNLVRIGDKP